MEKATIELICSKCKVDFEKYSEEEGCINFLLADFNHIKEVTKLPCGHSHSLTVVGVDSHPKYSYVLGRWVNPRGVLIDSPCNNVVPCRQCGGVAIASGSYDSYRCNQCHCVNTCNTSKVPDHA